MYRHHPSWVAARELVASGRIGRLRAVQSWFSYFNDDPANIRNSSTLGGGRAVSTSAATPSTCRGCCSDAEPTRVSGGGRTRDPATRRRRADERDPRVRGGHRDVHLLDAGRDRPARPHLRHRWPDLDRHPVQHPARPADRGLRDAGGDPPVAPATEVLRVRDRPTRTPSRPSVRGSDPRRRCRPRRRRRTRSPTCGSSSGSSRRSRRRDLTSSRSSRRERRTSRATSADSEEHGRSPGHADAARARPGRAGRRPASGRRRGRGRRRRARRGRARRGRRHRPGGDPALGPDASLAVRGRRAP